MNNNKQIRPICNLIGDVVLHISLAFDQYKSPNGLAIQSPMALPALGTTR